MLLQNLAETSSQWGDVALVDTAVNEDWIDPHTTNLVTMCDLVLRENLNCQGHKV